MTLMRMMMLLAQKSLVVSTQSICGQVAIALDTRHSMYWRIRSFSSLNTVCHVTHDTLKSPSLARPSPHTPSYSTKPFYTNTNWTTPDAHVTQWTRDHVDEKQLSAEVQYIIPTNHACRIVTHARLRAILTGRVCASLHCSFTPLSPTGYIVQVVIKLIRRYAIGREFDPVVSIKELRVYESSVSIFRSISHPLLTP